MTEAADKLWDLMEDNQTCMMVSATPGGGMRARPMQAILEHDRGEIWFYTRISSGKSEELEADGEVCLCFSCPKTSNYVSISGRAEVTDDQAMIEKHWSRFVDAWFPEGKDGGDVGMIRVTPMLGEYWDGDSSSVLAAIKMLVASERDETPDLGENRRVAM
ncbi:MAG: pyridoxamine 5'-phosphate oxidase family protein [Pseudomonadota bacterium]